MKQISLLITILLLSTWSIAQDDVAALRLSFTPNTGTARGLGMAGSFGAAGADFSNISNNPAGLAFFRSSQVSMTGNTFISSVKSNYAQGRNKELDGNFGFNSFGAVFPKTRDPKNDRRPTAILKSYFFGIGFNKTAEFTERLSFTGETQGSILQYYTATAQGKTVSQLDPFNEGLAYDTYLIYEEAGTTNYLSDLEGNETILKQGTRTSSGQNNEVAVAFGANLDHKWYLGAAVGIPFINYSENFVYSEDDRQNQDTIFNRLSLNNGFNTTGLGINVKLGVIHRFNKYLRVGASFTSPSRISLTDNYTATMVSNLDYPYPDKDVTYPADAGEGNFNYKQNTPWKGMASVAYFFGKSGFVNLEAEYVDYNYTSYDFGNDSPDFLAAQQAINNNIKAKYKGAFNLKFGAEYAYEQLRLRGGVAFFGSPYESYLGLDYRPHLRFSGGLGYYWKRVFIDFAYAISKNEDSFLPYAVEGTPSQLVSNDISKHQLSFTFAFKLGK